MIVGCGRAGWRSLPQPGRGSPVSAGTAAGSPRPLPWRREVLSSGCGPWSTRTSRRHVGRRDRTAARSSGESGRGRGARRRALLGALGRCLSVLTSKRRLGQATGSRRATEARPVPRGAVPTDDAAAATSLCARRPRHHAGRPSAARRARGVVRARASWLASHHGDPLPSPTHLGSRDWLSAGRRQPPVVRPLPVPRGVGSTGCHPLGARRNSTPAGFGTDKIRA